MGALDFKGLNQTLMYSIDSLVQSWLPGGKKEGREWVSTNPTRSDKKAGSFKVNLKTGKWSDFASGDRGGDLISLYGYLKGLDPKEAYMELNGPVADKMEYTNNPDVVKEQGIEEFVEAIEMPLELPAMPKVRGRAQDAVYSDPVTGLELYPNTVYRDFEGEPLYRVITTRKNGYKYPIPTSWCRWHREEERWDPQQKKYVGTGRVADTSGWNRKDLPKDRPLCGINYLFSKPESPVLIVEGEKCYGYVGQHLPEYAPITWRGGTNAVHKTNWSTIVGRTVYIWPDYDDVGHKAALQIADILRRQENKVLICYEPVAAGLHEDGWDVADVESPEMAQAFIKKTAAPYDRVQAMLSEGSIEKAPEASKEARGGKYHDSMSVQMLNNQTELRCLGYGGNNNVYFISRSRGVLVEMSPDKMGNVTSLCTLRPLQFWYDLFPNNKGGLEKNKCADGLQRWADSVGFFNPDIIRGAGVWQEENGDTVFHLGQKLLVNKDLVEINEYESDFMYEATKDLGIRHVAPLSDKGGEQLKELCNWLAWDCDVYGTLLAGFIAIAPMCGGLDWRPHIWVTGNAGSGKTTVISHLLRRSCGNMSLFVQGDSTAAGIRQRLGSDALPVIFDEFEGENTKRLEELQKTLDLARQSSSESGALMLKGSSSGNALEFKVRSSFAFSAINVNIQHYADASRITVLTLKDPPKDLSEEEKNARRDDYESYKSRLHNTITPDFVSALQMRTFSLLPVIRENARVFGRAVSNHLDSPRLGDQLGTLCAGAYSLDSKEVIGIKEAEEWVQAQDWTLSTPVDEAKDHDKCLSLMMQHILRLQGEHKIKDYTIGELIDGVLAGDIDKDADNLLKRHGFKVDRNNRLLYIANNHHQLAGIMKDTPYQSWNRLLVRCEGAVQPTNAIRFSSGTVARAVCLPVDLALGKATEETKPEWAF